MRVPPHSHHPGWAKRSSYKHSSSCTSVCYELELNSWCASQPTATTKSFPCLPRKDPGHVCRWKSVAGTAFQYGRRMDSPPHPPTPTLQGSNNCFNLCRGSDERRVTSWTEKQKPPSMSPHICVEWIQPQTKVFSLKQRYVGAERQKSLPMRKNMMKTESLPLFFFLLWLI